MKSAVKDRPLIAAGWLRALLCLLAFCILVSLGVVIYIFAGHKTPGDILSAEKSADSRRMTAMFFFLIALGVTYAFRRWVDRKSFAGLGLEPGGHWIDALSGICFGFFVICLSCLILFFTGHLHWSDILFDPKSLFLSFGALILIAFYQEILFRGYLLSNLLESFPAWISVGISAFLFMLTAFLTPGAEGLLPLLSRGALGIILGIYFVYYRNLWFPIFCHFGWMQMEGPLMGVGSPDEPPGLLQAEWRGDANLTGGNSGLEGSFVLLFVSLLCGLCLFLALQKKFRPAIKYRDFNRRNLRNTKSIVLKGD